REIQSTHTACIRPTLRSVNDGKEHGPFMEKLETCIHNHDREIELKHQVMDTNRKLQHEGKELVIAMEELKQCQLQQRNISATVDKLILCLLVLEMYSKLRDQMKTKSHCRFCKVRVDNIPKPREEIKDVSIKKHLQFFDTEIESTSPKSEQDSGILDVEDEEDDEENYYRKQRRKQTCLVLQPLSNMHETLDGYRKYSNQIVGFFFFCENRILHTMQDLVNRAHIGELWEMALSKTTAALRTHLSYCSDPNLMLDLKNLTIQFFDTLPEITDQNILDSDNYSPEMYKKMVGQFPFQDTELEKQPFPKLTRTLNSSLQNIITRKNIELTELVQIIINTTHLEKSCKYFEEFITSITNVLPGTVHATKLYGTMSFKVARHATEEEIYTNLNQEIDQFLQLAGYDWMTGDLGSKTSDYLVDVIALLHSTFAVFTHLPGKVTQTACMSACKHLATSLMQLLLEAEVRQLTLEALQQFNLDVRECGQLTRSDRVSGFQEDTLQLSEKIDAFELWCWRRLLRKKDQIKDNDKFYYFQIKNISMGKNNQSKNQHSEKYLQLKSQTMANVSHR
ncbi:hypothetical protein FD755_013343, partial [Muntiacus reevesi]